MGQTEATVGARRWLRPLFGVNVDPEARELDRALRIARMADELGLDLVGIQDHPYNGGFVDTWTLLAALGVSTRRVRLLPNVLDLPLRPPAMLAKAAATLDLLTGGRVELGLGAGAFWQGIASYGGPLRRPGEAVEALEEAISIVHLIWNSDGQSGPARFDGRFYRLEGAQPGPRPLQPIRIWVGAMKPRMLRLTGRVAQGWSVSNSYVPPEVIPELERRIDEAARRHGRSPAGIRRNYNLMGVLTERTGPFERLRQRGLLVGPAPVWADAILRYYRDLGMDTFVFWPVAGDEVEQVERFAREVVPVARQAIAALWEAEEARAPLSARSSGTSLQRVTAWLHTPVSNGAAGLEEVARGQGQELRRVLEQRAAGRAARLYVSGPVALVAGGALADGTAGEGATAGGGAFDEVVNDVQQVLQAAAGGSLARLDLMPVYRFVQPRHPAATQDGIGTRPGNGQPAEYAVFTPLRPGVSVEQAEQLLTDFGPRLDALYGRIEPLWVVEKWVGGGLFVQYMQARPGTPLDTLLQAMTPAADPQDDAPSVWQACVDLLVYPGRVVPMTAVGRDTGDPGT